MDWRFADQVLDGSAGDGGAEPVAEPIAQDLAGPLHTTDARDVALDRVRVRHAPDDVGVDGQGLVDGAALARVLGDQFGGRKVKHLQTAVNAQHRLDRPGPAKVQPRVPVVGAVVGGDVAAELRQVDELSPV